MRTFPASTSTKRTLPSSHSLAATESASPQTPRTRARSRSFASQALQRSLSRSASGRRLSSRRQEEDWGQDDMETTVKPARRVLPSSAARAGKEKVGDNPSPRQKPALSGLGRPAPTGSGDTISSSTARKPSSSTLHSVSASSSTTSASRSEQTAPLRTSIRRPSRGGGQSMEGEMKPPPPQASVPSCNSSRNLPRRAPTAGVVPGSSIPVAGRVLKKPPPVPSSVASDASTFTAGSSASARSATADAMAMKRIRAEGRLGGPPTLGKPRRSATTAAGEASRIPPHPHGSNASSQRQQQQRLASSAEGDRRRDSWVTDSEPGSARPSLSGACESLPSTAEADDESWRTLPASTSRGGSALPVPTSSFATPRKPSSSPADPSVLVSPRNDGLPPSRAALSYASPDGASSLSRTIYLSPSSAASPPISALLSSSTASHAPSTPSSTSLLTPRPRQVSLLRTAGRRNKPRESASLEEILRLGLQSNTEGAKDLELLMDEGSSAMMLEDLEGVAIEAGGAGGAGGGTPWRGRVLSLSVSSANGLSPRGGGRRGSVLVHPPEEDEEAGDREAAVEEGRVDEDGEEATEQEQQLLVLPLRPSTHEAASLRREIAVLQAELSSLRRQSSLAPHVPSPERRMEEDERVSALEEELQEQRERMEQMEEEHRAEVEAMEADLATLAVGASLAQPSSPTTLLQALPSEMRQLELDLSSALSSSASLSASAAYEAVESRARREMEEVRGEVETLRCLMGGLEGWEGALLSVQGAC
ncbi:hypothetical protein JCM11251_006057 [Rhodosporidiobolus azoricus]